MKKTFPILPVLPDTIELIDTHCHLDMDAYQNDLDMVIQRATDQGVRRIITVGIDAASSRKAVRLAERYPGIYATIGFHPHNARQATDAALQQLAQLAESSSVVGYGEIGLDYVKNYAPRDVQINAFERQIHLARELDLPVIIHDREAHADCLALLRACGPLPRGGVMHCFSGDLQLAMAAIDLGLYLSIPGVVTFNGARMLHEVVRTIDLRYLLLETDGPFLAPVPNRGRRNEPKLMLYTAQMVAELKQLSLTEVARATTANALRLFQLPREYPV
ncbi:TatD family hydrolase [Desulfobulbus alkaliphilus]|uniref:TatD family hydrolase n=1 Tax=Desulfobulbus alkaliphilus TaxID=869814 RepID=UPI0019644FEE|nr:TatD family hydrolase [Desulfobulbus alkaliphilus]MBM9535738.1 TatD family hydrolase [Desulfobulbus alkaliphilus]